MVSAGWKWVQETVDGAEILKVAAKHEQRVTAGMYRFFVMGEADADTGSDIQMTADDLGPVTGSIMPVALKVDGQERMVLTDKTAVGDFLDSQDISLGSLDRVIPAPGTPIRAGLLVVVTRVEKMEEVQTVPIKAKTVFKRDPNMWRGQSREIQAGEDGVRAKKFVVYTKDGQETLRKHVSTSVASAPRSRILAIGTRYSRSSRYTREIPQSRRVMTMQATAYDPGPGSCGKYADGYTSIGLKAGYGVVAVDPRVIPMRSRLFIEGYGYAIAGDVGGAIKGKRIDLGYDTRREALNFGRRPVKVYILD